jgi:hypothetical protein
MQMGMHHVDAARRSGKASVIRGNSNRLWPVGKCGRRQRGHSGKRRRTDYSPGEIHVILLEPPAS